MLYLTKPVNLPLGYDSELVKEKICKLTKLKASNVEEIRLRKQSVDARNKSDVRFVCSFVIKTSKRPQNASLYEEPQNVLEQAKKVASKKKIAVVGTGPAGLFASLYLAKCGLDVTLFERGSDIKERKEKTEKFFRSGILDENCNVQFGLGGAGAFSDGKLTTGISSPLTYTVFEQLVSLGAPSDILTSALPHIGTDRLAVVAENFRDLLLGLGANVMFDTSVTDFVVRGGAVEGVIAEKEGRKSRIPFDAVILACGHSARDVFHTLVKHGANVSFKPFAVGLRIEHSREFIDVAQYGKVFAAHRDLGAASYKLVNRCASGRGCYSFCMCPGGVVIPAASEKDGVVVNGMSERARNAANSNSAIVVTVNGEDVESFGFGRDRFSGLRFQEHLERKAYVLGGGEHRAPCQNVVDFLTGKKSERFEISPSYARGVLSADLRELLPNAIAQDIAESLAVFDRKIKGFGSSGILTGVESRTSSPVRIERNGDFESNIKNLYPVGEGAGYAGGIVSSAVDGLKAAICVAGKLRG